MAVGRRRAAGHDEVDGDGAAARRPQTAGLPAKAPPSMRAVANGHHPARPGHGWQGALHAGRHRLGSWRR